VSTPRRHRLRALLAAVAALAQLPAAAAETGGAGQVEEAPVLSNTPFDRQGMWVWYVERSEGGSVPAILARAKRAGIGTVYVKAATAAAPGTEPAAVRVAAGQGL
jgi:hypothetical protein